MEFFVKVRRFQSGDEAALLLVFLTSIRNISACDYTREQIEAWAPEDMDKEKWSLRMRTLKPFIVEVNGAIVGYADVQTSGYIDHFFVSGHYPRKGVGTLLMRCIHEEATRLDLTELTSNVSKTAEPFFIRHGFHLVERGFPVIRGVTLENALMRKSLP